MFLYWGVVSVANILPPDTLQKFQFYDKAEHFIAYMLLTVFIFFSCAVEEKFRYLHRHPFFAAFLFIALYGMINELIQLYVPGRSCDFYDWLADMTGASAALIILYPLFSRAVKVLNFNHS